MIEKKKIALVFICLNPPYWPFLKDVIQDAKKQFLTNHQVDYFVWSDMPEIDSVEYKKILENTPPQKDIIETVKADFLSTIKLNPDAPIHDIFSGWHQQRGEFFNNVYKQVSRERLAESIKFLRTTEGIKIIPTEAIEWPYPTLMRYHLFLQEEAALKEYDHILYLDADMRIVSPVTDEILGEGLMMAEHPMYALRREYVPPYEPNNQSTAYIPRLGAVITTQEGKPWFKPFYAAGGFQGGTTEEFIKAMKVMRDNIDKDFSNNYVAIWNDESHWNKYLYTYSGKLKVLDPSYVYPDSLIQEYYVKLWGKNFTPKIITLTKNFSTSSLDGEALRKKLASM